MEKNLAPSAAKGKFPYPHRTLHEVAYDRWATRPRAIKHVKFADWLEAYHG